MKNIYKRVVYTLMIVLMYILMSGIASFSSDMYGILTKNNYIELGSNEHEVIGLNIYKNGLYALKTSGENDIVLKIIDCNNKEVMPNYKEHDNNYYATYFFMEGERYYVDVKVDRVNQEEISRLWLFLLDDAKIIKDSSVPGQIRLCGEDKYFKYVPEKTDTYVVKSHGKIDIMACIYDEKGMLIKRDVNISGKNFKIVSELEEGKCYYIRVYSEFQEGTFEIEVKKDRMLYADVINLEVNSNLDRVFEGAIKRDKPCKIKFVPNVDGEFEFLAVSDMSLKLDVLDEGQKSVAITINNNKSYSAVRARVLSDEVYTLTLEGESNEEGIYKLKILNFGKLRSNAKSIVEGKNKNVLTGREEYLKFVCPADGCFNFELSASPKIKLSLYDENGKFIKEQKDCAYVMSPTIGTIAHKDDVLYLCVKNTGRKKIEYEVKVSNFSDLAKRCIRVTEGETYGTIQEYMPVVLYGFLPERTGVYTIKSTCKLYIDGRLYNTFGDILSENTANNMKLNITKRMYEGIPYYIKITDLYKESFGDFSLDISFVEENDVVKIQEDVAIEDEIEFVGDIKRYQLKADSDDMYAVKIKSDANIHVRMYSDKGMVIDEDTKYKGVNLTKGEEYIIEVTGSDELVDIGEYCIEVENFTRMVNDAQKIDCNQMCCGNLILSDTKDYYKFNCDSSGYYSIYTTGELNTYIKVYNMKCDLIHESEIGFDNNSYSVTKFNEGEVYLIEVGGIDQEQGGIYKVVLNKNDETECRTSKWIKVNKLITDVIKREGEVARYKFIACYKDTYFIDKYGNTGMSVVVYDKNKNIVNKDRIFELDENNLYYVEISSDKTGIYNFKIDNLKHAYDIAECIVEEVMQSGEIEEPGQCNYYKFVPCSKDVYLFSQSKGNKVIIEVFDSDGNRILDSEEDDGVNSVDLRNNKLYGVKIRYKNLRDVGEYEFFIISKSKLYEYRSQFMLD